MSVIPLLASSLGRRDEVPNQELAKRIASSKDSKAIAELVQHLNDKKDIAHDCIKTIYEAGYLNPALIAPHVDTFIGLLTHKNNRMQWGAMIALQCVAQVRHKEIIQSLPDILDCANKGSVITKDNLVRILVALCMEPKNCKSVLPILFEQLRVSLPNQFAMYAELALPVIPEKEKAQYLKILDSRLKDLPKDSQKKRIEKLIRKVSQD